MGETFKSNGITFNCMFYGKEVYIGRGSNKIAAISLNENYETIVIPSSCVINNSEYKITGISDYSFLRVNVVNLILPSSIKRIENAAFEQNFKLKYIDLSACKFTKCSYRMFAGCSLLETVILPNTVKSFESESFAYCDAFKELRLPASVSVINENAFVSTNIEIIYFCGLKDIEYSFPSTLKKVYVQPHYIGTTFAGVAVYKENFACSIKTICSRVIRKQSNYVLPLSYMIIIFGSN